MDSVRRINLSWLKDALVDSGYAVAAVNHLGNTLRWEFGCDH